MLKFRISVVERTQRQDAGFARQDHGKAVMGVRAMRKPDYDEGFTLIELLVVMIIIGILAAIAIPVFLNQQKKGYDASVKSDLRTVANELQTYYTDNQTYLVTGGWGSTPGSGALGARPSPLAGFQANYASPWTLVGPTGGGSLTQYVGSDTVNLSKNTVVQVIGAGAQGFCLEGWNNSSTNYYYYDSTQGGLLPGASSTWGTSRCTGSY